jgi:hypothetical protein
MDEATKQSIFPDALLDWSGHRGGGVRKLFYSASGRPSADVIRTTLLDRLEAWAVSVAMRQPGVPRIILLVGGPGNGKTEAVEFAIEKLDTALQANRSMILELKNQFLPQDGDPPPRLAEVNLESLIPGPPSALQIVQDASAGDPRFQGQSPASLLVQDVQRVIAAGDTNLYLACVNRGVLDDALIIASDTDNEQVRLLLEDVVGSVGTGPKPVSCWPLANFPSIAVWPMDIETLLRQDVTADDASTPGGQLLAAATKASSWPTLGGCEAGEHCPFCISREALSIEPARSAFLAMLRWYELASGKRWSFRDLGSLLSFILAGAPPELQGPDLYSPCSWAATQLKLSESTSTRDFTIRSVAPYLLVSRLYKHALFGQWPRVGIREFRASLKELDLHSNETLIGLYHFLSDPRRAAIPPTLLSQLEEVCDTLDPALADPDSQVSLSGNTTVLFRELDVRFSQSVGEGMRFIRKYKCLANIEIDLLKKLDAADKLLSEVAISKNRPETAARIQALVRDFACRLVRRSVGARTAAVRESNTLADFESVVAGHSDLLYDAAKEVEKLLNENDRFAVVLNTTFGEPTPSIERRVTLTTNKQKVKVAADPVLERPKAALRFLSVGTGSTGEYIPLTYGLYKSVRDLRDGMVAASLPRAVVALLDITRARLGGHIVRDEELLEDGTIKIGVRKDFIVRQRNEFLVKREVSA